MFAIANTFISYKDTELPPLPEVNHSSVWDSRFCDLRQNMMRNMQKATYQNDKVDLTLSEKELEIIRSKTGMSVKHGGRHAVFFFEGIPRLVLKLQKDYKHITFSTANLIYCKSYIKQNTKARECSESFNLFLLTIPPCAYVEIDGFYYIVQRRNYFENDSLLFQKALYLFLVESKDEFIQTYMKLLFKQLIKLTCTINLPDIKTDNISITSDGLVSMCDLDSLESETDAAITGLTQGIIPNETHGLFKLIPEKWQKEMLDFAAACLEVYKRPMLLRKTHTLMVKAEKQRKSRCNKEQYLAKKNIKKINTPLLCASGASLDDCLKELINKRLAFQHNFWDLVTGRQTYVDFNAIQFPSLTKVNRIDFIEIEKACNRLKSHGEILFFKMQGNYLIKFFC